MQVGDLVLTNYKDAIGKPHGVGVVVKVRERTGRETLYNVMWADGTTMAHQGKWLIQMKEETCK